jgi:DNA-binding LytR/AlgR family response regulator
MIRIGICDDDVSFAREFRKDIEKYFYQYSCIQDEIECICYSNAQEAIDKFWEDFIHVYFLDIEYGEQLGMDVARRLEKMRQDLGFVYVTNYEHYASKAFVCRPLGFVRKKYIEDDMGMVMVSVGEYLEKDRRVLTFQNNTKEVPVRLGNVQYVQIYNHTLVIALTNQKLELRDKLSRVEKVLCEQGFVRINRSCIVNLKFIEDIDDVKIILFSKEILYASVEKKKEVFIKWQYYKMNFDI